MTTWPVAVRKPPSERSPGKAAFRLCAAFEGLSLKAYPDPASQRARASRMKPEDRPSNWQTGRRRSQRRAHTSPDAHQVPP